MVLGDKAHEASITHSWITRQIFRAGLMSVKVERKTPDNYTNILGNLISNNFVT